MISNSFNIGASGLKTAQKVIDMISQNISNSDTPGYKKLENNNYELNFSGPENKPFLPAGVDTTISTANYPWLDRRMNDALQEKATSDAVKEGTDDLEKVTSDDTLEKSFTAFMNASHDLMQNPTDPIYNEAFNQTGKAFTDNMNRVDTAFTSVQDTLQNKIDLNTVRLQALQKQMSELTSQPNTQDVVSEMNYLKQQISQVTGSLAGYNKVLSEIIPPVTGMYDQAKADVVNGINGSYGKQLVDKSTGTYKFSNQSGGDIVGLVEFGNQKFNYDMGRIKTVVGSMQEASNIASNFGAQNLDATSQAYNGAYGVDLTDQAVKMQQYQRIYEANAQVIKTADQMIGTLLNIFQ